MKTKIKLFQARLLCAVALAISPPLSFAAAFSDANWISMGGLPGANGTVTAAVVDGSGNLYISGSFTVVGNVISTNIAKWNGSSWSALGSGMDGPVYALAVSGSDLYVGGSFTNAGGIAATNIAKWNGTNWSAPGSGIGAAVHALAASGTSVYAGGYFTNAGSVAATNIAKWDGSSWTALGSGMDGSVTTLAVSGSDLYAAGGFATAGGMAANGIAKWNGTEWSALGSGMINGPYPGSVSALAVSGSDVYAGGYFTTAGGTAAVNIAKWDGSSWTALGSGISGGYGVNALAVAGGALYALNNPLGGMYPPGYVYKWDANSWSIVGYVNGNFSAGSILPVYALAASGSDLYVGGYFTEVNNVSASDIAKWNGSSWSPLGSGMTGIFPYDHANVSALAVSGTNVYASGDFATAGDPGSSYIARYIVRWNGNGWSALGTGIPGFYGDIPVNTLALSGSDLYVGGNFTVAGGIGVNRIAKWDGSSWSALGSGIGTAFSSSSVSALAASYSNVYVGGSFSTAGGVAANGIARWDGSSWSALDSGMNGVVSALAVSGSDLYAGGSFTTAGGIAATNIAKWDGNSWTALGSGMNGVVSALAVSGSNVYAGGQFTTAGGIAATNIAKWDGSSWTALGSGMSGGYNPIVSALAVSGGNLYAGGPFTIAGGTMAIGIAKWDGTNWSALASGIGGAYPSVNALAASGSDLYAGGIFTMAGGKASAYVARAIINPPILAIEPDGFGGYFLRFDGVPGSPYRLQRASALSGPWATSSPQTAPASGWLEFWDVFPPPGQALYRSVGP